MNQPPPADPPLWATAVTIPTSWTPEQALAVFELLDTLRGQVWSLYGRQIQALLRDKQRSDHADAHHHARDHGDRSP